MSDFLHNLAARTLATVPAIRPRLASLYEPPQPAAELTLETIALQEEAEEQRRRPVPPEPRPADAAPLREARPHETPQGETFPREAASSRETSLRETPPHETPLRETSLRQTSPPEVRPPAIAAPAPPAATPVSERANLHPLDAARPAPPKPGVAARETTVVRRPVAPPPEPPRRRDVISRRSEPPPAHSVVVAPSDPPSHADNAAQPRPAAITEAPPAMRRATIASQTLTESAHAPSPVTVIPALLDVSRPPEATPSTPAARTAITPRPVPPRALRVTPSKIAIEPPTARRGEAQREPAASETQPPAIQVTIGRVEVRAVPAAEPPARKPAPASGLMNLDEYLRRREGKR
ncbi:MAG: hypothetical protein AABO58_19470 [Acidobacteriota bacterium]